MHAIAWVSGSTDVIFRMQMNGYTATLHVIWMKALKGTPTCRECDDTSLQRSIISLPPYVHNIFLQSCCHIPATCVWELCRGTVQRCTIATPPPPTPYYLWALLVCRMRAGNCSSKLQTLTVEDVTFVLVLHALNHAACNCEIYSKFKLCLFSCAVLKMR